MVFETKIMRLKPVMNYRVLFVVMVIWTVPGFCAKKNVLFLMVDDLRPEIGAYDNKVGSSFHPNIFTPNLDALAARSLVMKNAYVQMSVCSPSRTSLLTGRRPDTSRVYDIYTYWRDVSGNFTTLPQYFKQNGYETGSIGKVFHPGKASGFDDPVSWTLEPERGTANFESKERSWEAIDDSLLEQTPLIDQQVASRAEERLQELSVSDKPFFLAVGFYKPHLPFVFPASMLDYYPEESVAIPDNQYVPDNLPLRAWQIYGELRAYDDMSAFSGSFNTSLPVDTVRALRRAYFASVSYVDAQVGRVLQKLDNLGLTNNTVISFLGDHGFHLGEHGQWCKLTSFEEALRAPLMIAIPERTECGIVTEQLTEFVDLFPTLVEATELPAVNKCGEHSHATDLCVEGTSLLPLITVPSARIKSATFSLTPRKYFNLMGYTIRTEEYRYTEWLEFDYDKSLPKWDSPDVQRELYDHVTDPGENNNIVGEKPDVAARLSAQLRLGWRGALVQNRCLNP